MFISFFPICNTINRVRFAHRAALRSLQINTTKRQFTFISEVSIHDFVRQQFENLQHHADTDIIPIQNRPKFEP